MLLDPALTERCVQMSAACACALSHRTQPNCKVHPGPDLDMTVAPVQQLARFDRFRVPAARGWRTRGGGYHVPVQPPPDAKGGRRPPHTAVGTAAGDLLLVELEPERQAMAG